MDDESDLQKGDADESVPSQLQAAANAARDSNASSRPVARIARCDGEGVLSIGRERSELGMGGEAHAKEEGARRSRRREEQVVEGALGGDQQVDGARARREAE